MQPKLVRNSECQVCQMCHEKKESAHSVEHCSLSKRPYLLQDVAIEGGPGALMLLRDADAGCLRLTCFHLDLDLSLRTAINVWTASMTHKPYALDPDFDL